MNPSRDAVETSYRFCRRLSGRAGSSFHAGFMLLSREKRRAMEALYAFMRHTDDLADEPTPQAAAAPDDSRREALTAWRAALEQALRADREPEGAEGGGDKGAVRVEGNPPSALTPALSRQASGLSILPALADAVRRYQISHEHLYAVIDGVEMDLSRQRYETFDELRVYCERVASAVGMACIHIWGFRGPEAFEPARKSGIALQLTNILRDLKEDAAQGRVYLPLADLRDCGYSVAELQAEVADERFGRLMALEVARAEQFYVEGAELIDWLEPQGKRIFGLMMATYRAVLDEIARFPAAVFRRHVRLSGPKRFQLVARWCLLPPRKAAL